MKNISEKELEVLMGYFSQVGEEIETYTRFEKISDGL